MADHRRRQHTFVWDNVAFDGPFTYRDFSYDALDVDQPNAATNTVNLGKFSLRQPDRELECAEHAGQSAGNRGACSVQLLLTKLVPFPAMLNVTVNGHAHPTPWPYPDKLQQIRGVPLP